MNVNTAVSQGSTNYWVQAHDPVPFVDRTDYRTFGAEYQDLASIGEAVGKGEITVPADGTRVLHKSFQPERGPELRSEGNKWFAGTAVSAAVTLVGALTQNPVLTLGGAMATMITGAVGVGTHMAASHFESAPQIEEQGRIFQTASGVEYRPIGEETGQEIYRFAQGTA